MTYEISSKEDLNLLREHKDSKFILTDDIDMSSRFVPSIFPDTISKYLGISNFNPISEFSGILDGNGYTIKNLRIFESNNQRVSLIEETKNSAEIKNINLENIKIHGKGLVGGIVSLNRCSITNCCVSGEIHSRDGSVGGIASKNDTSARVANCRFDGIVNGNDATGGCVGRNWGTVKNNSTSGLVKGWIQMGGICGKNPGEGIVQRCSSDMSIMAQHSFGGGLVGSNNGKISNSYFHGYIKAEDFKPRTGIILGENISGNVENCYILRSSNQEGLEAIGVNQNDMDVETYIKEDMEEIERNIIIHEI